MLNSLFIRFDSRGASDWKVRACGRHGRVEIGCDEEGLIHDKRLNILDVIPPFPTPFVMARMNLHWLMNHRFPPWTSSIYSSLSSMYHPRG